VGIALAVVLELMDGGIVDAGLNGKKQGNFYGTPVFNAILV